MERLKKFDVPIGSRVEGLYPSLDGQGNNLPLDKWYSGTVKSFGTRYAWSGWWVRYDGDSCDIFENFEKDFKSFRLEQKNTAAAGTSLLLHNGGMLADENLKVNFFLKADNGGPNEILKMNDPMEQDEDDVDKDENIEIDNTVRIPTLSDSSEEDEDESDDENSLSL